MFNDFTSLDSKLYLPSPQFPLESVSSIAFDLSVQYPIKQSTPSTPSSQLGLASKFSPNSIPSRNPYADRFIPSRHTQDSLMFELGLLPDSHLPIIEPRSEQELNTLKYQVLLESSFSSAAQSSTSYSRQLNDLPQKGPVLRKKPSKLLKYHSLDKKDQKIDSSPTIEHPYSVQNSNPILQSSIARPKIADKPYKVLQVPLLEDDFYLNPIDWSKKNTLAISLKDTVYLWSEDGKGKKLCKTSEDGETYTSVNWARDGELLAAGTSSGKVELWDINKSTLVRSDLEKHVGRIGCLAWQSQNILGTGSQDSNILIRDIRVNEDQGSIRKLKGHKQEVCSLKWSPNGLQLASGGNDHKVCIWDWKRTKPEARFSEHKAAVKALAWSPHQRGLLLSGGGSTDQTIKVWNTLLLKNMVSVSVESQVCNLAFSPNANEFVSTHGYQNNEIVVWKFPEFSKIKTLEGHKNRVLFLTVSPDGEKIVTGAGSTDGSLRFWDVFPKMASSGKAPTELCRADFR